MAKARKSEKTRKRRRFFLLGLSSFAVITIALLSIGHYWVEIYAKYQEKKQLEKKLVGLKEKEEALKVDADKLQDPDYIARYAREKYLYSKDGEFILRIP